MTRATRLRAVLACLLVLAAIAATTAVADSTPAGDPQLVDVTKQVSDVQKKLNDLLAHGGHAKAGKLLSGADCGYGDPLQVFAAWGDDAIYTLAPQGDLSTTTGWTLNKQAAVADDADPFTGADHSLRLANGAEAATPAMCVTLDNPTIRFFVRDVGGNGKANLKVDVLYEDFNGNVKRLTVGKLKAGSDWQPSVVVPMYMNMLAQASADGVTAVAFDFKAEGLQKNETLAISSLYVDPWKVT